MPYRIDLRDPPAGALDRLIEFGALDVEAIPGGLAALMPDGVPAAHLAAALDLGDVTVSPARGRDDESVWILGPRQVRVGRLVFVPPGTTGPPDALTLSDGPAFGTGLHPTTALCLEAMNDAIDACLPSSVLDVGTGSGILALAALRRGVPRAVGLDIDLSALLAARENARLNSLSPVLHLVRGGAASVGGAWPLVLANLLPAPLIDIAPDLTRRVAHGGRLILSGIRSPLAADVEHTYRRLGLHLRALPAREGWTAIVLAPSW